MSKNRFSIALGAALLMAFATQMVNAPQVTAGKCLDQTGCNQCCPECNHCCNLDAEMGEVEKKCFEVETEVICIPRVVFPWQVGKSCFPFCGKQKKRSSCNSCDGYGCSACVHNGAKTRKVKILKTRKYKCPKCEYTWSPVPKACGPCGNPGCCDAGCDGGCDAAYPVSSVGVQSLDVNEVHSYRKTSSAGLETVEVHHR